MDFANLKYLVIDEFDRLTDVAEFCTYILPFKDKLASLNTL
jgi:superfamily II DNA/RNA helicase